MNLCQFIIMAIIVIIVLGFFIHADDNYDDYDSFY